MSKNLETARPPLEINHLNATLHKPNGLEISGDHQGLIDKIISNKRQDMGIGKLGNLTFVRKFRWTIKGIKLQEQFAKRIKINYQEKKIEIELYETVHDEQIHALDFLEYIRGQKELLHFSTYDGCGYELYKHCFKNVTLEKIHPQEFDYALSDESTLKLTLSYENVKTLLGRLSQTVPESRGSVIYGKLQSQT
ncbi:MAG: hypothetical protein ACW99G_07215 [Candidatus Thorarchaeota archaeon]|jgi:hypothetical protein